MEDDVMLRDKKSAEVKSVKPMLYADINVGRKGVFRIAVHKGDNVGQLADDFAKKHNISVEKKVKLMLYLNIAIEKVE